MCYTAGLYSLTGTIQGVIGVLGHPAILCRSLPVVRAGVYKQPSAVFSVHDDLDSLDVQPQVIRLIQREVGICTISKKQRCLCLCSVCLIIVFSKSDYSVHCV